jgi:phosphohistidine phosphatase
MEVIIIRHADAGERDAKRYPDDDLRPLSDSGRRKQTAASQAMQARGIHFDHLVTSPLLRAVQTAAILAEAYGRDPPPQVSDALGHACTPAAVVRFLSGFPGASRVALVGHEPALSRVAAALVGGHPEFELKKSGVIGIGFDGVARPGAGTLLYHLKPTHPEGLKTQR